MKVSLWAYIVLLIAFIIQTISYCVVSQKYIKELKKRLDITQKISEMITAIDSVAPLITLKDKRDGKCDVFFSASLVWNIIEKYTQEIRDEK